MPTTGMSDAVLRRFNQVLLVVMQGWAVWRRYVTGGVFCQIVLRRVADVAEGLIVLISDANLGCEGRVSRFGSSVRRCFGFPGEHAQW